MTLTPRFRFGPIKGVISAKFALSRGTSPSVCVITVPPIKGLDLKPKPMSWSDGFRSVTFKDCIINDVSPSIDPDGHERWHIAIVDRRWKWKYGYVSGRYNVRSGGVILAETKKTVQELAKVCFEAMGEKNPDVSRMPNELFPHFDWTEPTPPNVALDQLCQLVNCHVVLNEKDVACVYPDGFGRDVPTLPSTSRGVAFDFGAGPGKVSVVSAPVEWQFNFDLYPMGLDVGNEVKSIWDLSYMPFSREAGERTWGYSDVPNFLNIDKKYRKLAQETVWRWFQIVPPGWTRRLDGEKQIKIKPGRDAVTTMPGFDDLKIESHRQFFPLLDHQLYFLQTTHVLRSQVAGGEFDPKLRARRPPEIYGIFNDREGRGNNNVMKEYIAKIRDQIGDDDSNEVDDEAPMRYEGGFRIDQERSLVIFDEPVFRYVKLDSDSDKEGFIRPPILFLRVATNFYHSTSREPFRLKMTKDVPNAPVPKLEAYHVHNDVVPEYRSTFYWAAYKQKYNANKNNNRKDVDKRLKLYLDATMRKYETKTPAEARYPMLVEFAPDGLIAQVSWEITNQGEMYTLISKEREEISNMPTYDERRQAEQLRATLSNLASQKNLQDPRKGNI